ncbi:unnamed protein product, partial [Rotaria sp. Silwood1]
MTLVVGGNPIEDVGTRHLANLLRSNT